MADVGKYRAVRFQAQHGEELESILAAGGLNPQTLGSVQEGEYIPAIVSAVLTVMGDPDLTGRVRQFVTEVWDHPLQQKIENAEDEDRDTDALNLRREKRRTYRRLPGFPRNEILKSMMDQEEFKQGFLSSYLSLLPGEMAEQMKKEMGTAFQDMKEQLTPSKENTDTGKKKSGGSPRKSSSDSTT